MNETGNSGRSVTVILPERLTLSNLISHYQSDPESGFHALRYAVRENHRGIHDRIARAYGDHPLAAIDTREFKQWHRAWVGDEQHIAAAHAYMAQLRTLINHGFLLLTGPDRIECFRLSQILSKLKFPQPAPRDEALTADQAEAIRWHAHNIGWHSIALAQAMQFDLLLRQKDIIGEWVPVTEAGETDIEWRGQKWLRGVRWNEIEGGILTHVTSKRQKKLVIDVRLAPMVMDEITNYVGPVEPDEPCLICESTAMPWSASEFRRKWRIVADYAGVPKNVKNMDSRAGGITEASEAGADLEHIKHAATHSNIAMTQRYSRNATAKIAGVQAKRAEHRAAQAAETRTSQPGTAGGGS